MVIFKQILLKFPHSMPFVLDERNMGGMCMSHVNGTTQHVVTTEVHFVWHSRFCLVPSDSLSEYGMLRLGILHCSHVWVRNRDSAAPGYNWGAIIELENDGCPLTLAVRPCSVLLCHSSAGDSCTLRVL